MCGLFGVVNYGGHGGDDVKGLIEALGKSSEYRGTDAGGISYYDVNKKKLVITKASGAFSKIKTKKYDFGKSPIVMGHTRMTTQGSESKNENNHPFPSSVGKFAMAHNGVLSNDDLLIEEYNLNYNVDTDSYVVVALLDKLHNGVVTFDTLKSVVEKIGGTFNFTFMDSKLNLWIVRHNNPLYVLDVKDLGIITYASTKEIMFDAFDNYYDDFIDYLMTRSSDVPFAEEIPTKSGEIICITSRGEITRSEFKPKAFTYSRSYTYPKTKQCSIDDDYYYIGYSKSNYGTEVDDWQSYYEMEKRRMGMIEEEEDEIQEELKLFDSPSKSSYVVVSYGNSKNDEECTVLPRITFDMLKNTKDYVCTIYSDFLGQVENVKFDNVLHYHSVEAHEFLKLTKSKGLIKPSEGVYLKEAREWASELKSYYLSTISLRFDSLCIEHRTLMYTLLNKFLIHAYIDSFGEEESDYSSAQLKLEVQLFKLNSFTHLDEVACYLYYLVRKHLPITNDLPF